MKTAFVVYLILCAGYFIWRFVIAEEPLVFLAKGGGKRVTAVVKEIKPGRELVIEIDNNSGKNVVREIALSRELAVQLGVEPPQGFHEEPLTLSKEEENNKEASDIIENYNRENVRLVGEFSLAPDAKTLLSVPVKITGIVNGSIMFIYSEKLLLGGSISYFSVDLSEAPSQR